MSSFTKRRSAFNIKGTKTSLQNGQTIISSGNPSLDHIFGGGFGIGSVILIEEDKYVNYSRVLAKYFMAEGVCQGHSLFVASLEENPEEMVKKLPVAVEEAKSQDSMSNLQNPEDMRIAFRYNALPKVDLEQKSATNLGHFFDLSKQIDEEELKNNDIVAWVGCDHDENLDSLVFSNEKFQSLISKIKRKAQEDSFNPDHKSAKNILRICLNSIGSPLWYQKDYLQDVLRFLVILRAITRNSLSVCMITMPTHLFHYLDDQIMPKINNLIDFGISLESFAGSEKETNPAFKEYHGLLHITKISALNTLAAFTPETLDLAFKLRRKKFVIEKLHLPPELQEVSDQQREINDIVPSISCGSASRSKLDF